MTEPTTHTLDVPDALLTYDVRRVLLALVNGAPGLVWAPQGRPRGVLDLAIVDGKIVGINLIANPERIDQSEIVLLDN